MKKVIFGLVIVGLAAVACVKESHPIEKPADTVEVVTHDTVQVVKDTVVEVDTLK